MVTKQEVFVELYGRQKNFMTPHVDHYYGSIDEDGIPDKSDSICELSHGKFKEHLVYGVTVIKYNHDSKKWESNLGLSKVTTDKVRAIQYIKDICCRGFSIAI